MSVGAASIDAATSAAALAAPSAALSAAIRLRSKRSTSIPAGANSAITGTTCASPTAPSASGDRVRNHSSQATATPITCLAMVKSARAATKRTRVELRAA